MPTSLNWIRIQPREEVETHKHLGLKAAASAVCAIASQGLFQSSIFDAYIFGILLKEIGGTEQTSKVKFSKISASKIKIHCLSHLHALRSYRPKTC